MKIAPTLCYKLGLSSQPVRDGSCREKRESAWHEHCSGTNRKRMERRSCVWHRWRTKQTAGTKEERMKALTQKEDKPGRRRSEPAALRTRWCFLRLHRHPSTATDAYEVLRTCAGGTDFTASLLLLPFEKTESSATGNIRNFAHDSKLANTRFFATLLGFTLKKVSPPSRLRFLWRRFAVHSFVGIFPIVPH